MAPLPSWCIVVPVVLLYHSVTITVANVIERSDSEMSCTTASNEPGVCVYQYQCNSDGVISQSGENIIDVRQPMDDCQDHMMECCAEPITTSSGERAEGPIGSDPEGKQPLTTTARTVTEAPKRPKVDIPPYNRDGCGHRNPDGVIFTIKNNQLSESEYGEYPWSVAVFTRDAPGDVPKYRCGGALIDRAAVLTTASCVHRYRMQVAKLIARLGEWDMGTDSEPLPHVDVEVEKIRLHPGYRESSKVNDIAIIVLRETIELNHTIGVVCLPTATVDFHAKDVIGVGWGDVPRFVTKGPQTILKKSHLRSIAHDTCQTTLRQLMGRQYRLDRGFLCAQAQSTEMLPCTGDTGSPYAVEIVPGQERYYLVGLASWGYDCNKQTFPTIMTNVAVYREWIDGVIKSEDLDDRIYRYEDPTSGEGEEE